MLQSFQEGGMQNCNSFSLLCLLLFILGSGALPHTTKFPLCTLTAVTHGTLQEVL